MQKVKIRGAYHSKFGRLEDSIYSLYKKAVEHVLVDAEIEAEAIDGVFVGNFSGGTFNSQENIAPYIVNINDGFRFKPAYRVETACTSGSSAIHMAIQALKSGIMKKVMVVGVEKMNDLDTKGVSRSLSLATLWPEEGNKGVNAPCMFGNLARGYMEKYSISKEELRVALASISAKAYHHGATNPDAHIQKPLTSEEILSLEDEKNPTIYDPLRLHDCSLISDGSAALILEADDNDQGIYIDDFYNASDYLSTFGKDKKDHFLEGAKYAVDTVLQKNDRSIKDIDAIELHDCFTITELLCYSALGLAKPGQEIDFLLNHMHNSNISINTSGGLKSKGHPIGATGVAMHVHIYKTLLKNKDMKHGLTLNIGGAGTSNAVSLIARH